MIRVPWWILVLGVVNAVVLLYLVRWDLETTLRVLVAICALLAADVLFRMMQETADDVARAHARAGAVEDSVRQMMNVYGARLNLHSDRLEEIAAWQRERATNAGHPRGVAADPATPPRSSRITVNKDVMGGVPCIRGLRIPVATIVGMRADGMTDRAILEAYPDLQQEDIEAAIP